MMLLLSSSPPEARNVRAVGCDTLSGGSEPLEVRCTTGHGARYEISQGAEDRSDGSRCCRGSWHSWCLDAIATLIFLAHRYARVPPPRRGLGKRRFRFVQGRNKTPIGVPYVVRKINHSALMRLQQRIGHQLLPTLLQLI